MKFEGKYLLALNAHPKIGSQTMKKILAIFDDPADIWRRSEAEIRHRIKDQKFAELLIESRHNYDPDRELDRIKQLNIGYHTIYDKDYPQNLAEIPDAPVLLYVRGNAEILKSFSLAVVGSRKYTSYGKKVAYDLSKKCAENGLTIISGLALGIDAFAHRAALDAGGKTIGVLGCGLDRIYPASNFHLGREIIEKGGAIISEFPPGTLPMKQNFPARNRIIAGLSQGVLVVEAAIESGALITAYQALEYNREVFAVPSNIDSGNSVGTNLLIKNGAKLVTSEEDILEELNIPKKALVKKAKEILPETEEEKSVYRTLSNEAKLVDDIIKESGLNIIAINSALTTMEIKGMVVNLGGSRYKINK